MHCAENCARNESARDDAANVGTGLTSEADGGPGMAARIMHGQAARVTSPDDSNTATRAREAAEVLLTDYLWSLTSDEYLRCLRARRTARLHHQTVASLFRLYRRIAGDRVR